VIPMCSGPESRTIERMSPRLIGRRPELEALRSAITRAAAQLGSVVLIGGDAGIGKSRLVSKVTAEARDAGAAVLVGECLKLGQGELPYAPIVGALRSIVRERGIDELVGLARAGLEELEPLLPELRALELGESARDGSQARLYAQLLTVFTSLARSSSLVLVIEDLHWADSATRDFLFFLVRAIRDEPIALVLTYRTDDVARAHATAVLVHELERDERAVRLPLKPLSREEVREQVAAIRGEDPAPGLVDRLLARAEGNPFFTEELLAVADAGDSVLPQSLQQALLLRQAECPPDVAAIIRMVTVAGRELEHELLKVVVALPDDRLRAALEDAVTRHVLVHPPGSTKYRFRHAVMCEAAYADLLPSERQRRHRTLAEAIECRPDLACTPAAAAAMLSHHWYESGEWRRALPAAVDAGLNAESGYGFLEALRHYERALEIWDEVPPADRDVALDRIEVLRHASDAAGRGGETPRAIELARQVLERVDPGDATAAALAHERLARHLWTANEGLEALAEARRAVELMPFDPTAERATVVAAEAQMLMLAHRAAESRPRCEEALAIARSVGASHVEANVLNTMSANFSIAGEPERGVDAAARAREISRRLGLVEELARGYLNGSDALDHAERLDDSLALATAGLEACRNFGVDRLYGNTMRGDIAARLLRVGEWDRAEQMLDEIFQGSPSGVSTGLAYGQRAMLHVLRGDDELTWEAITRGELHVDRSSGSMWRAPVAEARATAELWEGRPEDAQRTISACLDAVADSESLLATARIYELGVRAAAEQALYRIGEPGSSDRARARIAALCARADGLLARMKGPPPLAVRASRQAAAAEASRVLESDPDAWQAAAQLWDQHRNPYQAAYARCRHAEALLAGGGNRRMALASARDAHTIAGELGARPLIDAIAALARRGRLDLGLPRGDAPPESRREALERLELTERELEVLALVGEGMTNREIGAQLFISDKTASVHVSRILGKLSVSNRAAAAAAAQRFGVERTGAASPCPTASG